MGGNSFATVADHVDLKSRSLQNQFANALVDQIVFRHQDAWLQIR